jgi:glycosyltransferase involved in cell wall biosynthesis
MGPSVSLRIALLPSLIAPLRAGACFGGAEMVAHQLGEALAARGHRVTVFGISGSVVEGAELVTVPATPAFRPGEMARDEPGPFPEIGRWIEAHPDLDALHLHLNDPAALREADRLARLRPRLVVIATLHLSAVFPATTAAVQSLSTAQSPIRFAAPSASAARSYRVPGVRVIPNGVAVDRIAFVADPPADGRLVFAGRRSPEKGLADAIAIAARAGRPLVIAGPPDDHAPPIPPWVTDLGHLPRSEVPPLLGSAAATLLTSQIAEAHPLVVLESLAAGTPVVAFDVGGVAEILDHPAIGARVAQGDLEAAARIVRSPHFSRAAARATAEEHFRFERLVADYEGLYRGL